MNGFTKEAWAKAGRDTKDELLFGAIINLSEDVKKIHRWKYINTAVTGICSFIGGITGILILSNYVVPILLKQGG